MKKQLNIYFSSIIIAVYWMSINDILTLYNDSRNIHHFFITWGIGSLSLYLTVLIIKHTKR